MSYTQSPLYVDIASCVCVCMCVCVCACACACVRASARVWLMPGPLFFPPAKLGRNRKRFKNSELRTQPTVLIKKTNSSSLSLPSMLQLLFIDCKHILNCCNGIEEEHKSWGSPSEFYYLIISFV